MLVMILHLYSLKTLLLTGKMLQCIGTHLKIVPFSEKDASLGLFRKILLVSFSEKINSEFQVHFLPVAERHYPIVHDFFQILRAKPRIRLSFHLKKRIQRCLMISKKSY